MNGFSTSLPEYIQDEAIRLIPGFENVKMFRPGYAIEYDYFPPTQLTHTLETKLVENLFFAGQINGTTGYEEAACQGLMAGINAHLKVREQDPFILGRSEAYIGVLIDDLITKGTEEPYRMFTSRAEYRLLLRQDNADIRLTEKGHALGLASEERLNRMQEKVKRSEILLDFLKEESADPKEINAILEAQQTATIKQKTKWFQILSRPQIDFKHIANAERISAFVEENELDQESIEQMEIQCKYAGYLDKEKENADKLSRLEHLKIPGYINYDDMKSLSTEAKQKLKQIQPTTIAQASRISGVSPADISVLLVHMGR